MWCGIRVGRVWVWVRATAVRRKGTGAGDAINL
jgi:hypothetical protein